MKAHKYIGFEDLLDSEDYGVIVTSDGRIKGVWMPRDQENDPVPAAIVRMCVDNFGIDPNSEDYVSQTLH